MLTDEPGEGVFIDDVEADCVHARKKWKASRYNSEGSMEVPFRRWPGAGGHEDVEIEFRTEEGGDDHCLTFGCPEELAALGDCLRMLAERWSEKLDAIPAGTPRPKE